MPDQPVNTQTAPPEAEGTVVPAEQFDAMVDDSQKHDNLLDYATSAGLGAINTALPVVGSKLIGDPEWQKELKEANPVSYGAGQAAGMLLGPVGEAIGAAGNAASSAVEGGVLGASANLAVQSALLQTTDEVAKKVLGDPNQSAQTAISDIALSGLIGGALGGIGGLASKGIQKVADTRAGEFLTDFKDRIAEHLAPEVSTTEKVNPDLFKFGTPKDTPMFTEGESSAKPELGKPDSVGAKAADAFVTSKLSSGGGLGFTAGSIAGHATGIPGMSYIAGTIGAKTLGPTLDAIIKPLLQGAMGISGEGFGAAQGFIKSVVKGDELLDKASKALFATGSSELANLGLQPDKSKLSELSDHLDTLQNHPEAMMNIGGHLGHYLPDQQTALAATAQNAVNYLNLQKPRSIQSGILDKPIDPSPSQMADYNRTLRIAEQPLAVIDHVTKGTLSPKDVQDVSSLYPSLVPKIIQKINDSMIEHTAKGGQVPFKIRKGLSMLMGQPMDSTFTQPAIMAAQATYLPATPPTMPQGSKAKKGSPSKVGKIAENAQTPEESRIKALSKA